MNIDRSLIFSYLEEDNIQRAYFRVRPLLTLEGDVQQEALQLWPNEGGLRIVPDRNEQHTFKGRMRNLGAYCVVDLRMAPAEAGKIRTNKNFRPDRGEANQYILYSDTVHELPAHTFYQLLDGQAEEYVLLAEKAVTPLFYIREGDTVYGPVNKNRPESPAPAKEAEGVLFEITCPDQVSRTILCMEDEPTTPEAKSVSSMAEHADNQAQIREENSPKEVEKAPILKTHEDTALPIGESLQILDESKSTAETLQQLNKPVSSDANLLHQRENKRTIETLPVHEGNLSGTPLIRTPLRVSTQQNKNRTQEVISNQWNVGKYEAPAPNLPSGASMRNVQNPVQAACARLREAWNASSAHDQLTDCILSLDGIRSQLESKLCNGSSVTIMQRVLRDRLHDLEAERLTALCELDKAHRDVDAYKQTLLNGLSSRIARETAKLEEDKSKAETLVSSLKTEINALMLQKEALLQKVNELQNNVLPEVVAKLVADAQMTSPVTGLPLRMRPVSGAFFDLDAMISRISKVCKASSVQVERNQMIAALVLLSISPRIGIACSTTAPAATLLKNIACAMGWAQSYAHQISLEQTPVVGLRPVDSTPAILTTSLANHAPIHGVTKLLLGRTAKELTSGAAYESDQWPILMLPELSFVPVVDESPDTSVSLDSICRLSDLRAADDAELDAVLAPVLQAAPPLSGDACKALYHFISVCAGLMEHGLPAAVDWGILLWIVPSLERDTKQYNAVKALLDEYPLSLSML